MSKLKKTPRNLAGGDHRRNDSNNSLTAAIDDDDFFPETPKYKEILSSERFFVSTSTSNSLIKEAQLSAAASSSASPPPSSNPNLGVAMEMLSWDPFHDFRKSMEEMVGWQRRKTPETMKTVDWEFMEMMLLCFLELNDKEVHKYILGAFADVVPGLWRAAEVVE